MILENCEVSGRMVQEGSETKEKETGKMVGGRVSPLPSAERLAKRSQGYGGYTCLLHVG